MGGCHREGCNQSQVYNEQSPVSFFAIADARYPFLLQLVLACEAACPDSAFVILSSLWKATEEEPPVHGLVILSSLICSTIRNVRQRRTKLSGLELLLRRQLRLFMRLSFRKSPSSENGKVRLRMIGLNRAKTASETYFSHQQH